MRLLLILFWLLVCISASAQQLTIQANVSNTRTSSTFLYGRQASFTDLVVANCTGCGGISNTISTTTVSASFVYANQLSATTLSGNGSGVTNVTAAAVNWYGISSIPTQVTAVSNGLQISMAGVSLTQLSVTNVITAARVSASTVSGSFVYGNQISGTIGSFGTVVGALSTAAQTNITSVGNLTGLTVSGAVSATTLSSTYLYANQVSGSQLFISGSASASTVTGTFIYGRFVSATQGRFDSLSVTGIVTATYFEGNGSRLTNLPAGGAPSWYAVTSIPAYVQNVSSGGAIFSTGLGVNGTVTATAVSGTTISGTFVYGNQASFTTVAGTLSTAAQPNVISVGTLTGLTVNGSVSATIVSATYVYANQLSVTLAGSRVSTTGGGVVSATYSYANQASYTTLTVLSCSGCSGSSNFMALTSVPQGITNISSSSGNVTATVFVGDTSGSRVSTTNVSATFVEVTRNGTVSASYLYSNQASATTLTARNISSTNNLTAANIISATSYYGNNAVFAWGNLSTSPAVSVVKSFNIASITRISQGYYGVSFTTPAADADYSPICISQRLNFSVFASLDNTVPPTTTGFVYRVLNNSGNFTDSQSLHCVVYQ